MAICFAMAWWTSAISKGREKHVKLIVTIQCVQCYNRGLNKGVRTQRLTNFAGEWQGNSIEEVMSMLSLERWVHVDWVEMERGVVGREKVFEATATQESPFGWWWIIVHGWSVRLGLRVLCFLWKMVVDRAWGHCRTLTLLSVKYRFWNDSGFYPRPDGQTQGGFLSQGEGLTTAEGGCHTIGCVCAHFG